MKKEKEQHNRLDAYHSEKFWDNLQTSDEDAALRSRLEEKTLKLLNKEIEEKTTIKDGIDQVHPTFRQLHLTYPVLDKLLYSVSKINALLGYKSEIRFDLTGPQTGERKGISTDIHLTYGQKVTPSSVHAIVGKDPYLAEILNHYEQERIGIAHSHGPHAPMHSGMDDTVVRHQLYAAPRMQTISLGAYAASRIPLDIKFLPSLVVNDRTRASFLKKHGQDYHISVGVVVPKIDRDGIIDERVLFNRDVPLHVNEDESFYDPVRLEAQILDRVEVVSGDGIYERLVHPVSRKTGLSVDHLLTPINDEPDYRQQAIDKRNVEQQESVRAAIARKMGRLDMIEEPVPQMEKKSTGLWSRISNAARNMYNRLS